MYPDRSLIFSFNVLVIIPVFFVSTEDNTSPAHVELIDLPHLREVLEFSAMHSRTQKDAELLN